MKGKKPVENSLENRYECLNNWYLLVKKIKRLKLACDLKNRPARVLSCILLDNNYQINSKKIIGNETYYELSSLKLTFYVKDYDFDISWQSDMRSYYHETNHYLLLENFMILKIFDTVDMVIEVDENNYPYDFKCTFDNKTVVINNGNDVFNELYSENQIN